ncbi:MAG TPA: LLM class flavin-dependent oxidoreductase [Ktedonobacterales bacterium]|nr:LLM class flavin-dependent oxidoreductase [Ktedonobacterales bacterium]
MQVGVGLPTTIPGTRGDVVLDWARRADAGPFSSVAVLDRLLYDSYDPLISLAAAAGATTRVRLATLIVIGPLRNPALLAKSAASLDALSGGRLTLGLSVGARHDDYEAAGVDYRTRGKRLVEQLATFRDHWEDERIGPAPARPGGPELLVGGLTDAAYARVARYADGYVHNGGPPRAFARAAERVRAAWLDAGRPGKPRLWGQSYFALGGEAAAEAGTAYLRDYYAFTGHFVERIVAELLTTPQGIAQLIRGYAEAGCDELALFPATSDPSELERLADVITSLAGTVTLPAPVTAAPSAQPFVGAPIGHPHAGRPGRGKDSR